MLCRDPIELPFSGSSLPPGLLFDKFGSADDSSTRPINETIMNNAQWRFLMSYPYGQYSGEELSDSTAPLPFSTWITTENEQPQAQAQQQQQQHIQQHSNSPDQPSPPSLTPQQNPTPQLEDQPSSRVTPSQPLSAFDDTPIRLHHVPQRHDYEGRRESLRRIEHRAHETRSSVASTSTVGPTRQTRSSHVIQQQHAHPYDRRPPSAMSSAPPSRQQPMTRFSSVQPSAPGSSSIPSSGMHSPVVPMTAVPSPVIPSPASTTSRIAGYGSAIEHVVLR
ncbi:hypothetical protein H2248_011600 [Termitomyces sp. 'cryptogamus']|nr:hypothetical protein H2248_011600 [Termitomyces sp. 'cryptogamus']